MSAMTRPVGVLRSTFLDVISTDSQPSDVVSSVQFIVQLRCWNDPIVIANKRNCNKINSLD